MKQLLLAALMLTALTTNAQKWQNIQGNGNIKKESRTVSSFTAVESNGSFDVELSYGENNTVEVEADENILPVIVTKVESNKLILTTEKGGFSTSHRLKVYVTMAHVEGLVLRGSGNIHGSGAFYNKGTTHLEVGGSGNMKLGFAQFNTVDASIRGSGNIDLTSGNIDNLNAGVYGSGNLNTFSTNSKNVVAKTNGSGNVKVKVSESLNAESNGSGNVYYKGDITNVNIKSNGSGKVVKQS
jgi:hypothetical protein